MFKILITGIAVATFLVGCVTPYGEATQEAIDATL